MRKLLCGLAALPFLAGAALADQTLQLSDTQMDKVTAGFDLSVIERSNTSWTQISIYETGRLLGCNQCYLVIGGTGSPSSRAFSVQSAFGPTPNFP
jgi:hypothetical protein